MPDDLVPQLTKAFYQPGQVQEVKQVSSHRITQDADTFEVCERESIHVLTTRIDLLSVTIT